MICPTISRTVGRSKRAFLLLLCSAGLAIYGCLAVIGSGSPDFSTSVQVSVFDMLNGRFDSSYFGDNYRISIVWWIALSLGFTTILACTRYGNGVFATGGNAEAARLQGVDISRIRIVNFVISGGMAATAGIIQVARLKSVDPLRGEGMELEVIAAVVIGGTLLSGGYGSILGSAIGTALTGMLRTGLVLIHVPSNAFRGAIGVIMIVAVIINSIVGKDR